MPRVHVFSSLGRFASDVELRAFVDPTYTEDGDMVPSDFMREVELEEFEPMAIEAVRFMTRERLVTALHGFSYGDQWIRNVVSSDPVDAVICVFAPNAVQRPDGSSLTYHGAFEYWP